MQDVLARLARWLRLAQTPENGVHCAHRSYTLRVSWRAFDVDADVFAVARKRRSARDRRVARNRREVVLDSEWAVFWGNAQAPDGSIVLRNDERTGGGEDEIVEVNLSLLPKQATSIDFWLDIYGAEARGQYVGMLGQVTAKLVDTATGRTVTTYNLPSANSFAPGIHTGRFERHWFNWYFVRTREEIGGSALDFLRACGLHIPKGFGAGYKD